MLPQFVFLIYQEFKIFDHWEIFSSSKKHSNLVLVDWFSKKVDSMLRCERSPREDLQVWLVSNSLVMTRSWRFPIQIENFSCFFRFMTPTWRRRNSTYVIQRKYYLPNFWVYAAAEFSRHKPYIYYIQTRSVKIVIPKLLARERSSHRFVLNLVTVGFLKVQQARHYWSVGMIYVLEALK